MATIPELELRLKAVQDKIQAACLRAGRLPASVKLLLVSKTVSTDVLRQAIAAGGCLFGENKAQELKTKAPQLADTPARWHFIGHLQSNKLKDVLPWVELIHSLDSLALAQKLNQRLLAEARSLPVLMQVNTSYEDAKSGVLPAAALELLKQLAELPALRLHGLMTIGALHVDEQGTRDCFRRLRELAEQGSQAGLFEIDQPELSMGMSGDYEWAIEEGATLVRVGSAIFGPRA